MKVSFSKYHGTGNDFIIIDNRRDFFPKADAGWIRHLCHRRFGIGADGLILLENDSLADFRMVYYNADGRVGSFCGNGARCLAAFAHRLLKTGSEIVFLADNHFYPVRINSWDESQTHYMVSIQMADVSEIQCRGRDCVLNTGSPHYVTEVTDLENMDVLQVGRKIRNSEPFRPDGINVNFMTVISYSAIKIRTYERGVEEETWSCGTGAVAAAICASFKGLVNNNPVIVYTSGGLLKVYAEKQGTIFRNVFLEGEAVHVFDGVIP
jgi:diaminopimelate epimerase